MHAAEIVSEGGWAASQDLKQAMPELARGLQQLLDFEGDVEATFARNFVAEHDFFGAIRTVELKPGGSNIPVTNDNRQEFVHLLTLHYLDTGIVRQFGSFAKGFFSVRPTSLSVRMVSSALVHARHLCCIL